MRRQGTEDQKKLWGFMIGAIVGVPITVAVLVLLTVLIQGHPNIVAGMAGALVGAAVAFIITHFAFRRREKQRTRGSSEN